MGIWQQLWNDEAGVVLSAEAVMVGSVAVLGSVVGLGAVAHAVNEEMVEMASAVRSLDQSYVVRGHSGCRAWTAGSYYIQPRVEDSVRELCGEGEADIVGIRTAIDADRDRIYGPLDAPQANELPPKKAKPEAEPKAKPKKSEA